MEKWSYNFEKISQETNQDIDQNTSQEVKWQDNPNLVSIRDEVLQHLSGKEGNLNEDPNVIQALESCLQENINNSTVDKKLITNCMKEKLKSNPALSRSFNNILNTPFFEPSGTYQEFINKKFYNPGNLNTEYSF